MAIRAYRDFGVALREQLPVDTCFVLTELVGSQRRIVLAHERRIGVAAPAERRDLASVDFSSEAGGFAHGIRAGNGGVSAMATRAGHPFLRMDILGELFRGHLVRRIERAVAVETGVLRLRVTHATTEKY
jgi:hypothetical protein